jgi:hypothetical protein
VPEVADPLQWLKLLAIAAVALGLPMALVARHRRAGEPITTRTRLVGLMVVLGLLGFVVGVEATDLVPPELEPLLYPIVGLGVIVDLLVAFGHRPR